MEYHGYGEEDNVEKNGQGKQNHLPYNIEAVGKNIKLVKGEREGSFEEENQDIVKWGWRKK